MRAKAPTAQQLKTLTDNIPPTYRSSERVGLGVAETLDTIDRIWRKLLSEAKMIRDDFKNFISHTSGAYSTVELLVYKDAFSPYVDVATQLAGHAARNLYDTHPSESLQILELHMESQRGMSRALDHPCAPSFAPIYIHTVMENYQELREKLLTPGQYVKNSWHNNSRKEGTL